MSRCLSPARASVVCIVALLCILQKTAEGATSTWIGGGADQNWGTAQNWQVDLGAGTVNVVPTFPAPIDFTGSPSNTNAVNNLSSVTVQSVTFDNSAAAYTVSG